MLSPGPLADKPSIEKAPEQLLVQEARSHWWWKVTGHDHTWADEGFFRQRNKAAPKEHVHWSRCTGCGEIWETVVEPTSSVCSLRGCPGSFWALAAAGTTTNPAPAIGRIRFR